MSGSVGTLVGSDPLYGTTVSHLRSCSLRLKISPITAACCALSVICPRQAAVTHSLLRPTLAATSAHFRPCLTLVAIIFSVTSSRLMLYSLCVHLLACAFERSAALIRGCMLRAARPAREPHQDQRRQCQPP